MSSYPCRQLVTTSVTRAIWPSIRVILTVGVLISKLLFWLGLKLWLLLTAENGERSWLKDCAKSLRSQNSHKVHFLKPYKKYPKPKPTQTSNNKPQNNSNKPKIRTTKPQTTKPQQQSLNQQKPPNNKTQQTTKHIVFTSACLIVHLNCVCFAGALYLLLFAFWVFFFPGDYQRSLLREVLSLHMTDWCWGEFAWKAAE